MRHLRVPMVSILCGAVIGTLALGPYKSWSALVNVVTGSTAIMYAFAPVSLAALQKVDGARKRSYRVPAPSVLLPTAFCSANLILYWGGFSTTWKLAVAMLVGLVLFAIGAVRAGTMSQARLRNAIWIGPWLAGHVVIGALGRYGGGSNALPEGVDIAVVVAFSLAIFYWAIALTLRKSEAAAAVAKDARQIDYEG